MAGRHSLWTGVRGKDQKERWRERGNRKHLEKRQAKKNVKTKLKRGRGYRKNVGRTVCEKKKKVGRGNFKKGNEMKG